MREMRATLEADLAAARAEAEAAEARAGEAEARATAGEGALDAARASLLCTGVLVTKHARNGKPYQRFIRATPDGGRLEWASVVRKPDPTSPSGMARPLARLNPNKLNPRGISSPRAAWASARGRR
mmetsp:Transcript_46004/g.146974  ORF Transcript_46004/g.146974 Transcript_46004/m.146974 type:complete len:126 (-) Transcript_46004:167-544(-)